MLSDPQVLTISTVANSLPRTDISSGKAVYTSSDANLKLTVSHVSSGTRTRHLVRVDKRVIAENPLTAVNAYQSLGVYLVIDQPTVGFSASNIDAVVQALASWLTTSAVTKIVGLES